MIKRTVFKDIIECLSHNKVALLFGTRRVGKTTLLEEIITYYKNHKERCLFINCDTIRGRESISTTDDQILFDLLKNTDVLAIDEAQNVETIGRTLKIIHDVFPAVKVIATGSSSFDLANKTGEPLVGRMRQFLLYPFSTEELRQATNAYDVNYNLEHFLKYGMYPCIYGMNAFEAHQELEHLVSGYLYKDLLSFDGIRNSNQILRLLQCLALQIGSEVSFNELAVKLQISANTVKKYIDLLEKCFVIFTLPAFAKNIRNEIAGNRTRKIYFYDIGIRNALAEDFRGTDLRNDIGGVWENFCIAELKKKAQREGKFSKFYFWRTTDQKEIDLLEEENGEFSVYEFKFNEHKKASLPMDFNKNYRVKNFSVINAENWYKYF